MKKGKFGIVLCFYPIAAFACVILKQPVLCALLLALAIFAERDEWAIRQTLQAWALSLVVCLFSEAIPLTVSVFQLSFVSDFLQTVSLVFSTVVYLAAIVFSILAIIRVMKDREADIPLLSEIAYRVCGKQKPKKWPAAQFPPAYVQPQAPVPPAQAPQPAQPQYDGQAALQTQARQETEEHQQ